MKVTLDACLFGAIVAAHGKTKSCNRALDIGTGTGLLALMMAQSGIAYIDAVEVDAGAAQEATANIEDSRYREQVHVCNTGIEQFSPSHEYDLIISNPPFFSNSLKGPQSQRNQARHNDSLPFDTLCQRMRNMLAPSGEIWLLLPVDEMERLLSVAQQCGLFAQRQWQIHSTVTSAPYRTVVCLGVKSPIKASLPLQSIAVRTPDGAYTTAFSELLRPYYLKL